LIIGNVNKLLLGLEEEEVIEDAERRQVSLVLRGRKLLPFDMNAVVWLLHRYTFILGFKTFGLSRDGCIK